MKKIISALLLICILALCLVGCGGAKKTLALEMNEGYVLEVNYSEEYTVTDERANQFNQKPTLHDIKIVKGEYEAYVQIIKKDSYDNTRQSRLDYANNPKSDRIKTEILKEESNFLFDKETHLSKDGEVTAEYYGYLHLIDESKDCAVEVFSQNMPKEEVEKLYKNISFTAKDK